MAASPFSDRPYPAVIPAEAGMTPMPMLRNNALMDATFRNLTRFFAFLVFSLLAAILVSLAVGGSLSIEKFGAGFLWSDDWDPVQEQFGALVPIVGTLVTSA